MNQRSITMEKKTDGSVKMKVANFSAREQQYRTAVETVFQPRTELQTKFST